MSTHTPPREACGIFGIYAPGRNVAPIVFDGLYALQHRGQESAGMAVSDGTTMMVMKDMGLVTQVFNDYKLASLVGHLAVGHNRYSTTGSSSWHNAQPMYRQAGGSEFAVGHNGNLTNTDGTGGVHGHVARHGHQRLGPDSRTGGPGARQSSPPPPRARGCPSTALCPPCCPRSQGAFSLVLADRGQPDGGTGPQRLSAPVPREAGRRLGAGLRDAGARHHRCPLRARGRARRGASLSAPTAAGACGLGRPSRSSPSCACSSSSTWPARTAAYTARSCTTPASRMGELLAEQAPVAADMVVGVPDSGMPAAEGYSRRSGVPFGQGLVKNRYIGRTFINPDPRQRALGVRRKLNPLREAIRGKRLVVVDDSIVRGTTTRAMVAMLREAGAREVHLRISSPPYRWPCFYGLDTGSRSELIAADLEVGEIRDYLGADSLAYLSLDALKKATGVPGGRVL